MLCAFGFAPAALAGAQRPTAGPAQTRASNASPSDAAPGVVPGQDSITVLGQTPWVTSGQMFQLRLKVTASSASTEKLSLQIFNRLRTRTDFDNAMSGHVASYVRYPQVVPLDGLSADPQGGVDVAIPVDPTGQQSESGALPAFNSGPDSGVFPLQLQLYDAAGVPQGKSVTTFLVYGAGNQATTGLPRLSVAVVVPVRSAPAISSAGSVEPVPAAESGRLAQLASVLQGHAGVPVSLAVSPATLDALASGDAADKQALSALGALGQTSDEVLPETYSRVSMSDLTASGLAGELTQQFETGAATLARAFGSRPSNSVWVFDGQVDQASVGAVNGHGANRLVIPDSQLTPLPTASRQTTFAEPTRLILGKGNGTAFSGSSPESVFAADSGLTADFNGGGGPVLAATRLLAELAMIQVETPGLTRGVAVVPPTRWSADPTFVETLLSGLNAHPLLQAVTVSQLFGVFQDVKTADVSRQLQATAGSSNGSSSGSSNGSSNGSGGSPGGGTGNGPAAGPPVSASPVASLSADVKVIRDARRAVEGIGTVLSGNATLSAGLNEELLVAESVEVSEQQRLALLGAISRDTDRVLRAVTLPGSSSITLTSTRGQVPLTILSAGGARARVQLRLSSQRLIFRPFNPAGGHCDVPTPTSEVCNLVISGENTTLKVPVEARSSGVFPLDVSLWTPDGALRLVRNQDTVRSTAVSGVGVVLIVVAVASLALWWARDLRHGRRARRLVPSPVVDEPELPDDDPVVRDFFDNPPPGLGGAGSSRAGPRT